MLLLCVVCNFNFGVVDLWYWKCMIILLVLILYVGIDSWEIKNILVGVLIIFFFVCKMIIMRWKKISFFFEMIEGFIKYIVL